MMNLGDGPSQVFTTASIVGSIAFALSGFMMGARKRLDLMGVFILAFLTANGGGVIRDLLVDRPPAIMAGLRPFYLTAGTVTLALVLKLQQRASLERAWIFVLSDAVGLVAFGITGAIVGIEHDLHLFGVVILSFLTATGGGIVRDILVNEVPLVLHGDFYGSVAILLGVAIDSLHRADLMSPVSLLAVFAFGLILRLIAYRRRWSLPRLNPLNQDSPAVPPSH
ncbi:trimeric intracellular cation channel family protein [Tautonia marina]|uniref:trimeric intracellular cation channel family protein n=1 Tax=Tautonia marina TaxID=2653855 RepID=UPI00191C2D42|nr:trimeric intracellular cation channel family protein [Tautonia marina]